LVFEVPMGEKALMKEKIPQLMSEAFELDVPLIVDLGVGVNWDEAH
jgi:DNA polymerase-1